MDAGGTISPQSGLRERALRVAEQRSTAEVPAYVVAWIAIVLGEHDLHSDPVPVAMVGLGALLFAVARVALHRGFNSLIESNRTLAVRLLYLLVIGNAFAASVVGVLSLYWDSIEPAQALIPAVGGVIATAGTMAMAMDPVIRFGIPLATLLPYTVGLILSSTANNIALAGLTILLASYLLHASARVRDDWWRAEEIAADQRERASELERLSITDGLTGLVNRLHFDQRLEAAWAQAQRGGGILSVLLIDLDHFKAINDSYGHAAGDACLEAAADALRSSAQRRSDLVARHGGEEFAILLPDTARPAALALAEFTRVAIENVTVNHEGVRIRLTASIGVATMAPMRETGDSSSLVDAADEALYAAKHGGRNRVVAAPV